MGALTVFAFACLAIYAALMIFFSSSKKLSATHDVIATQTVSIVIVARNESPNLELLFHTLSQQDYPHELIELLLFDDNSTDDTFSLATDLSKTFPFSVKIFSGAELFIEGKKLAQSFLVSEAKGELLLFSDADVSFQPNWVSSTVLLFHDNSVNMVCGMVSFSNHQTLFGKLMALEFAAMVQTSLSAISKNFPFMCNAANMAIRKNSYDSLQPEGEELKSGDDVFLLKSVLDSYGAKSIVANYSSMVYTHSPKSFVEFILQRIRWAGKSSKVFFLNSFVLSLLVFLLSLLMVILWVLSFWNADFLAISIVFGIKWLVDLSVLWNCQKLQPLFRGWIMVSALLSLFYPLYVATIALLSLKKTYLWKGRIVR